MTDEILQSLTLERFMKHAEWRGRCLVWTGSANNTNPQIRVGGKAQPPTNVRRVIYQLVHGPIPTGFLVGLRGTCTNVLCIHPDCLVARSKSKAQKNKPVSLRRKMRIASTQRAKSRLTMDLVREIRMSREPANALDAKYGLPLGYSAKIRRNERWIDFTNQQLGGAR